jgi:hypothetical protein
VIITRTVKVARALSQSISIDSRIASCRPHGSAASTFAIVISTCPSGHFVPLSDPDAIIAAKLDFLYGDMPVGHFTEGTAYPTVPGMYKYMPYRGLGHLRMGEELRRAGSAGCAYVGPEGRVTFLVRECPEYGS